MKRTSRTSEQRTREAEGRQAKKQKTSSSRETNPNEDCQASTSAANRVFSIPELVELILLEVASKRVQCEDDAKAGNNISPLLPKALFHKSPSDIFLDIMQRCRSINRTTRWVVDTSPALQMRTFRRPIAETQLPERANVMPSDKLFFEPFVPCTPFYEWCIKAIRRLRQSPPFPVSNLRGLAAAFKRENFPGIFVTQPPVTCARIYFHFDELQLRRKRNLEYLPHYLRWTSSMGTNRGSFPFWRYPVKAPRDVKCQWENTTGITTKEVANAIAAATQNADRENDGWQLFAITIDLGNSSGELSRQRIDLTKGEVLNIGWKVEVPEQKE